QPRPIDNGHSGAVLRDLSGNVRFSPMVAALAPGDDALGGKRLSQGQRLRLAFTPAPGHIQPMPLPDLAPEEYAEVVRLVHNAIDGDRFPLSARVRKLRAILDKLGPPAPKPIPFPAPKPTGTPSLVYAKLRGGRRRR